MSALLSYMNCKNVQGDYDSNSSYNYQVYKPMIPTQPTDLSESGGLRSVVSRQHRSNTPIGKPRPPFSSNRLQQDDSRDASPLRSSGLKNLTSRGLSSNPPGASKQVFFGKPQALSQASRGEPDPSSPFQVWKEPVVDSSPVTRDAYLQRGLHNVVEV